MFQRTSAHGRLSWRLERPDGGSGGGSYPIPRPRSEMWQECSPGGSGRRTHRRSADLSKVVAQRSGFCRNGDSSMAQEELQNAEAVKNTDEAEKLPSSHADHEDGHEQEHALNWREINRVLFVAAAAGAIWFLGGARNPYVTGIGVICAIVGGFPIFHEAYENIAQRRMTMELSMAIAIVAALAIREIFTALVITLFVLVAEILEGLTVGRGRTAIRHLVGLLPTTATVRRNESWQDVETKEIAAGDLVLVKPGTRIPVDGIVAGGHSFVDQATITGESMPAEKIKGSSVYAGTINQSGALEIWVDRMGRDTTFGKIIDAVER